MRRISGAAYADSALRGDLFDFTGSHHRSSREAAYGGTATNTFTFTVKFTLCLSASALRVIDLERAPMNDLIYLHALTVLGVVFMLRRQCDFSKLSRRCLIVCVHEFYHTAISHRMSCGSNEAMARACKAANSTVRSSTEYTASVD
eukprot:7681-Heterococcus_DN1.PRE.1